MAGDSLGWLYALNIWTLLAVKWTQQTPLVLALWSWMQGNFLMIFPQTTNYFLFHHYLYININMKKKHTTTTATATTTHLYNQETSKSFSCTFLVTYMQGRRKIHLKILGAPSVHSKWTKTMWFPLYFFFLLQLKVYLSGHLTLTLRALALRSPLPSWVSPPHHQWGCCRVTGLGRAPTLWCIFMSKWPKRLINCSAVESQTELTTSTSACSVNLVDNCDEQLCDEF